MVSQMTVFSQVLQMHCNLMVIGPQLIDPAKPLKVTYLLHGLAGNETNWSEYTQLPLWARDGHTLFILPSAGRSWYTDSFYAQRYFTYISQELPQICQSLFHISHEKTDTAIMGNSMGGYGALKCALSQPERFGVCCAFSPAALDWDSYLQMPECAPLQKEFQGIFGPDLNIAEQDRIPFLVGQTLQAKNRPIIRITCGEADFLLEQNRHFAKQMQPLDLDFRYDEWHGAHDWVFWNQSLKKMLDEFGY